MKTFVTDKFPQWAVCYAAYGESDTLTDEEERMVNKYMEDNNLCDLVDCSEDSHFSPYPDFGLACDVVEATFIMKDM